MITQWLNSFPLRVHQKFYCFLLNRHDFIERPPTSIERYTEEIMLSLEGYELNLQAVCVKQKITNIGNTTKNPNAIKEKNEKK